MTTILIEQPTQDLPAGFRPDTVVALDIHGTLVSRTQADDLPTVAAFRRAVSQPARAAGAAVVMVSAAPTREVQRVASLLDLGDQPAVAELGHVLLPAALGAPPRLAAGVTADHCRALLELRRWLADDRLPPGVFVEPKSVLVSLNCGQAPDARDDLLDSIRTYAARHGLPFSYSISDATIDVGVGGVDKVSGLAEVMAARGAAGDGGRLIAVGDSRNDLDMLRTATPGMCGCPANADPAVKSYVVAADGVVATRPTLGGTLQVLTRLLGAGNSRPPRSIRCGHLTRRPFILVGSPA